MPRRLLIAVAALAALAAVGVTTVLILSGSRPGKQVPTDQVLDELEQANSADQRDVAIAMLSARGPEVIEPLLARYAKSPAGSQIRLNAGLLLMRLPPAAAIPALERLAKLEKDEYALSAIRGQIEMLRKMQPPP